MDGFSEQSPLEVVATVAQQITNRVEFAALAKGVFRLTEMTLLLWS